MDFDRFAGRGFDGSMSTPALLLPGGAWMARARLDGGILGEAGAALGYRGSDARAESRGAPPRIGREVRFWMDRFGPPAMYASAWGHVGSVQIKSPRIEGSTNRSSSSLGMCSIAVAVGRRGLAVS